MWFFWTVCYIYYHEISHMFQKFDFLKAAIENWQFILSRAERHFRFWSKNVKVIKSFQTMIGRGFNVKKTFFSSFPQSWQLFFRKWKFISSVQFSSVTQSCPALSLRPRMLRHFSRVWLCARPCIVDNK